MCEFVRVPTAVGIAYRTLKVQPALHLGVWDTGTRPAWHVLRVPPSPCLPCKVGDIGDFPEELVLFKRSHISVVRSSVLSQAPGDVDECTLLSNSQWCRPIQIGAVFKPARPA